MTVRLCEACANPIWQPGANQLLCDLCMRTIDAQTELMLEIYDLDTSEDE